MKVEFWLSENKNWSDVSVLNVNKSGSNTKYRKTGANLKMN